MQPPSSLYSFSSCTSSSNLSCSSSPSRSTTSSSSPISSHFHAATSPTPSATTGETAVTYSGSFTTAEFTASLPSGQLVKPPSSRIVLSSSPELFESRSFFGERTCTIDLPRLSRKRKSSTKTLDTSTTTIIGINAGRNIHGGCHITSSVGHGGRPRRGTRRIMRTSEPGLEVNLAQSGNSGLITAVAGHHLLKEEENMLERKQVKMLEGNDSTEALETGHTFTHPTVAVDDDTIRRVENGQSKKKEEATIHETPETHSLLNGLEVHDLDIVWMDTNMKTNEDSRFQKADLELADLTGGLRVLLVQEMHLRAGTLFLG
ncbi:unnamed protein product [Protopolystoma xenopodis]|uniref:Uncharacterized protein n=1 Tax=Protopolystoma xenopodis TaxID=117903 RepID=A0A3S5BVB1_9PLAT|nr:unnamed protein product [Protopolystoma xenopodis]